MLRTRMAPVGWVLIAGLFAGALWLGCERGTEAAQEQPAAPQQATADQDPAADVFPERLGEIDAVGLAAGGVGGDVPDKVGAHDAATGYAAEATVLGEPVAVALWMHESLATADEAWGKAFGEFIGEEGSGSWFEAELPDGRALCCARFSDGEDGQRIASTASESLGAAEEALCILRSESPLSYPYEAGGWELAEPGAEFDEETVYEPIDGAAEQYFRYNFRYFYRGKYAQGDKAVQVDVYELASSWDAYGVQSAFRTDEEAYIGQEGYLAPPQLVFRQGPYFCRLEAQWLGEDAEEALYEVGEALSRTLGVQGPEPDMLALVAGMDPEPLGCHVFHMYKDLGAYFYLSTRDVLHLSMQTDCLLAKLPPEDAAVTLIAVRYPEAADAEAALKDVLAVALPDAEVVADGITSGVYDQGRWAAARTADGPEHAWFVGVFDAPDAAACEQLIGSVVERIR